MQVERNEDWRYAGFSSFSVYLGEQAKTLNRRKSVLWRLVSAGLFYTKLLKKMDPEGNILPGLTDPRLAASPESLELLEKIGRVAPTEIMMNYEIRTVDGTISRRELRDVWESYRPVLGGRTKRGRGVLPPKIDHDSPEVQASLEESYVLTQILRSGSNWLSYPTMDIYRAVHISGSQSLRTWYPATSDLVLLVAENATSYLQLHGVEVGRLDYAKGFIKRFLERPPLTDYQWFATTEHLSRNHILWIPDKIGIVEVAFDGVRPVRKAKRLRVQDNQDFLRELLKEVARTRKTVIEDENKF